MMELDAAKTDQPPPYEEDGVEDTAEENPVEYFCGFGKCRPKFLQIFRDAKFFTFLLCCSCFIEGTIATGDSLILASALQ